MQAGSKPNMLWVSFMNDTALSGSVTRSPFKLLNLEHSSARLTFDNNHYPFPHGYQLVNNPTSLDKRIVYERMGKYLWGSLSQDTNRSKWWTIERYENHAHALIFDLTQAETAYLGGSVREEDQAGTLGISIDFAHPVPANTCAMVTTLFNATIVMSHTTLTPDMDTVGV
jgi:hypothetical protein